MNEIKRLMVVLVAVALLPQGASQAAPASPLQLLYRFGTTHPDDDPNDGASPFPVIAVGSTLYGMTNTTVSGSYGTIFKINSDGTGYQILHSFGSIPNDGAAPESPGLTSDGSALYGTTSNGGLYQEGTVFKINLDGSNYQILYNFGATEGDGMDPVSELALSGTTLYGTTSANLGTIFQINTDGSGYQILYTFGSVANDGWQQLYTANGPFALVGSTFYGTDLIGGTGTAGTIFKINSDGSGYQTVYNFSGASVDDVNIPASGLTAIGNTLYGIALYGGRWQDGAVFKVNTDGSGFQVLHVFGSTVDDGQGPRFSLTLTGTTLYGATEGGGKYQAGTIFKINPDGSGYQILYNLKMALYYSNDSPVFAPSGSLAVSGSNLYGVGETNNNDGAVFSFSTAAASTSGPTPSPLEGQYTLLLSATASGPTVPPGTGYGTMTVSAKGEVTMAGQLPDGEPFSAAGAVTESSDNQLIVSKALAYPSVTTKGAKGLLSGTLTFVAQTGADDVNTSDLNGTLEWSKPAQRKGAYPAALDTDVNVIGSVYFLGKDFNTASGALPGFSYGTLELSDTGALSVSSTSQIEQSTAITVTNRLIFDPPLPIKSEKLTISLTPSTGVFKGSFVYPGTKKTTDFKGVLFQDQILGAGFFVGPDGGGTVTLTGT